VDGAVRGLVEELGIAGVAAAVAADGGQQQAHEGLGAEGAQRRCLRGPLTLPHARSLHLPAIAVTDNEWVTSYVLAPYDGPVHFNPLEVERVRWVPLATLQNEISASPGDFTPWLADELAIVLPSLSAALSAT
jgi:isopentenyldiphosphate isomerase